MPAHGGGGGALSADGLALDATVQAVADRLAEVKARADLLASEATLAARLPADDGRLAVRLPSGQEVALDAATIAALDPPDVSGLATAAGQATAQARLNALATEATLGAVLAELATKIEPADLAALATEGTLSALSGKVGVPAADDLLSLLREIRVNTATEVTRTETLELTAEQVQLNTDAVEGKLDTVADRIGTTGSAGTVAALLDAIRLAQINQAVQATVTNPTDVSLLATQATLAAVRDRLPAALVGGRLDVNVGALAANVTADIASFPASYVAANRLNVTALGGGPLLGDGATGASAMAVLPGVFNGADYARLRDATSSNGTAAGVGLLGAGLIGYDQTTYRRVITDANGFLRVIPSTTVSNFADGGNLAGATPVGNWGWNSTGWDRIRNNLDGTALASAARTATTSSADITNYNGDGALVILRVSAVPGTAPSLVVSIEGKDPVSGVYYALNAAPVAVTAVGTYVYEIGASGAAGGGITQRTAGQLPRTFRVTVTHGNANSVTYSVGFSIITA